MRTLLCPETSGFDYPLEQHRIAEEWCPQKRYSDTSANEDNSFRNYIR